jgi:acyl transferase domain-containing protein
MVSERRRRLALRSDGSRKSRSRGHGSREPIAIIGAACRLPGAPDVTSFWELLTEARDTVGEIPAERFDAGQWYDPVPGTPGRIVSRSGGFLPGIDKFDAGFFGITSYEAVRLDPQQRLLLEVTWEALEGAGQQASVLAGSRTGVYTGCASVGYWDLLHRRGDYDIHTALGSSRGVPAGRISHQLDLRGLSMSLDASCATSLLGVHLACQALWAGQLDLAVVGAVNLLLEPDLYLALSSAEMLSSVGRCRFGDAAADGFVRSEGVVALVLKPLSAALADGDQVWATVLGSGAVNSGRSSATLTGASSEGQQAVLREALLDAGVRPGQVDYVEAHGAGTRNGDDAELDALSTVMGDGRPAGQPCLIGSAKSNLGHTEIAAGLVGLLKTVLALRHGTIPATLHVQTPHPLLNDPSAPLELVRQAQPWPERQRPAVAGVSSFGMAGINCHVLLSQAPPVPRPRPGRPPAAYILPLSARDERALAAVADGYADELSLPAPRSHLQDVCFTAATRRTHHQQHRAVVVSGSGRDLVAGLRALTTSRLAVTCRHPQAAGPPRVAFVFPGQGADWDVVARDLLATCPPFARELALCSRAVAAELGWSPAERLRAGLPLSGVDEVQPAQWAVQVALARVWRHWGIDPDLVIGHSMGEIAAAVVSGALTRAGGAAVVCRRSRLLRERSGPGAMWAVQAGADEVRAELDGLGARVSVAVQNSRHSAVLAGEPDTLARVVRALGQRGIESRRLPVDYASHAPQMEVLRDELTRRLADVRPRAPRLPMHSTTLDRPVDGPELDAGYWMENLRRPVLFAPAVRSVLAQHRPWLFIEISMRPTLTSAIADEAAAGVTPTVIPSVRGDRPALESMLTGLGVAYAAGCDPDWSRVQRGGRLTELPGYPWQRKSFWAEPAPAEGRAPRPVPAAAVPAGPSEDVRATATVSPAAPAVPSVTPAEFLVAQMAQLLAIPEEHIDPDVPVGLIGLDSLLATLLRAQLAHQLGVTMPDGSLHARSTLREISGLLETPAVSNV